MTEPAFDLFGDPVAGEPAEPAIAPGQKPVAPSKRGKPAPRPVTILPPEPPKPPEGPPLMGPTAGGMTVSRVREHPWFEVRVAPHRMTHECLYCKRRTGYLVHVVRPWDAHDIPLCETCQEGAPPQAESYRAAPWVIRWLRRAGVVRF